MPQKDKVSSSIRLVMQSGEVISHLKAALNKLLRDDTALFDVHANEVAISSKLGSYVENEFSDYDVDCEYDRYGEGPKLDEYGLKLRPDIVVHQRKVQPRNLVAIEVKPGRLPDLDDEAKLIELTDQLRKFKYLYGFFIGFERLGGVRTPVILPYEDGRGLPKVT